MCIPLVVISLPGNTPNPPKTVGKTQRGTQENRFDTPESSDDKMEKPKLFEDGISLFC